MSLRLLKFSGDKVLTVLNVLLKKAVEWNVLDRMRCTIRLGRLQKRGSYGCGDIDRDEAIGGEQVIFAALVHDAQVTVVLGVLVRDDDVDLVPLE